MQHLAGAAEHLLGPNAVLRGRPEGLLVRGVCGFYRGLSHAGSQRQGQEEERGRGVPHARTLWTVVGHPSTPKVLTLRGRISGVTVSLAALAMIGLAATPAATDAPESSAFETTVKPFLAQRCLVCHNAQLKSGGVDLAVFGSAEDVTKDAHTWDTALVKLKTGQMPPEGLPRPDAAEVKAVTEWVEKEFDRVDQMAPPNPGRVTARRLNRTEYNNTVRDLLGVDIHPADDFPQDDAGYGFDNIGDVLSLSPALLEKYLTAADKVTRAALFGPDAGKPSMARLTPRTGKVQPSTVPLFDYDLTGLSLPNALDATHRFPVDGEYMIRIVPGGTRPLGSEPVQIAVWIDGEQVKVVDLDPEGVATFELDQQELFGTQAEVKVRVTAGEHTLAASMLRLYEGLPAFYGGPNPSKRVVPEPPEFKPRKDAPPERVEARGAGSRRSATRRSPSTRRASPASR